MCLCILVAYPHYLVLISILSLIQAELGGCGTSPSCCSSFCCVTELTCRPFATTFFLEHKHFPSILVQHVRGWLQSLWPFRSRIRLLWVCKVLWQGKLHPENWSSAWFTNTRAPNGPLGRHQVQRSSSQYGCRGSLWSHELVAEKGNRDIACILLLMVSKLIW